MKKITIIFALFVFVWSIAAAAGIDESPLYGTYLKATEYSDGDYSMTLFHLFPDHTAYYLSSWVSEGKPEGAYEETTVWMFTKEAKVEVVVGGYKMVFSMGNYGQLKDGDGFIYTKVYPRRDWN